MQMELQRTWNNKRKTVFKRSKLKDWHYLSSRCVVKPQQPRQCGIVMRIDRCIHRNDWGIYKQTHTHAQLIFNKMQRQFGGDRIIFLTIEAGTHSRDGKAWGCPGKRGPQATREALSAPKSAHRRALPMNRTHLDNLPRNLPLYLAASPGQTALWAHRPTAQVSTGIKWSSSPCPPHPQGPPAFPDSSQLAMQAPRLVPDTSPQSSPTCHRVPSVPLFIITQHSLLFQETLPGPEELECPSPIFPWHLRQACQIHAAC